MSSARLSNYIPVPESGCWLWCGFWNEAGYGRYKETSRAAPRYAHRLFYEAHRGPIPEGMHVCHKCDTPSCVNPDHLFVGTHTDNCTDRQRKGRYRFDGERNGRAVLTLEQVATIRDLDLPSVQIAKRFGISRGHVRQIKTGARWGHLS